MNEKIEKYLKYYSSKSTEDCKRTNDLIRKYQQKTSNGYGYISLAKSIQEGGDTKFIKGWEEGIRYCAFLFELEKNNKLREFEAFKYLDDKAFQKLSPLNVRVNAEELEPNQKWHLIVSYLGSKIFSGTTPSVSRVSCPELWMWMFETADNVFTSDELDEIYKKAVEYREKKIDSNQWSDYTKPFKTRLEENI